FACLLRVDGDGLFEHQEPVFFEHVPGPIRGEELRESFRFGSRRSAVDDALAQAQSATEREMRRGGY
ncbi:hypothetical protein, partial [uncultured Amaricoccus sp.]|uniref:hypothetical protein n=1 Tax=uncultured Amaricoccus sp. TaxID=339341 RepID=UPI0026079266